MELQELIGKKVVRTESVWYDNNNNPIEYISGDIDGLSEDDSFQGNDYITVTEVTNESIQFIQHFRGGDKVNVEKEFKFNNTYDQGFLDDNWEEYKGEL